MRVSVHNWPYWFLDIIFETSTSITAPKSPVVYQAGHFCNITIVFVIDVTAGHIFILYFVAVEIIFVVVETTFVVVFGIFLLMLHFVFILAMCSFFLFVSFCMVVFTEALSVATTVSSSKIHIKFVVCRYW